MPLESSLTLIDLPFERLLVACTKCGRSGEYFVDTLIATHGRHYRLTDFLSEVSEDCPKEESAGIADQCAAQFPQLRDLPQRRADDPKL